MRGARLVLIPLLVGLASCADRLGAPGGASAPGGVGGGGGGPPVSLRDPQPVATLVSAAAGDGVVLVEWAAPAGTAPGDLALFSGPNPVTLVSGAGQALSGEGGRVLLSGLANGADLYLALGLSVGGGAPRRVGAVLRARPGTTFYVDGQADPSGSGTSPSSPTPDLVAAAFNAFLFGGGNVWVAEGEVAGVAVPLFGNVHLYGGFPADFDLDERDPATRVTTLTGLPGQAVVDPQVAVAPVVVDGFRIEGAGVAASGVDVTDTPADLRALEVRGCARGIKLRASLGTLGVTVVGCDLHDNTLQGLSGEGALDLELVASRLERNGQEGADFNDLVAPDGGTARLAVLGSLFASNRGEGLDVDLLAPDTGGGGGRFEIDLDACDFDANGLEGLVVDVEYDVFPAWSADIVVRGSGARTNLAAGMLFDLDQNATLLVQRVVCAGNAGDGIHVSSETWAGMATVASSFLYGNRGRGLSATTGNVPLLATSCVLLGNFGGGLASDVVESAVVSSVAFLQPAPWTGARAHRSIQASATGPDPFRNAPEEMALVTGISGDSLVLSAAPSANTGATVELDDDGVAREALSISGATVVLDAPTGPRALPATLALFEPGADAEEDLRTTASSPARDTGLAPPGAPPVDAGVFGPPTGGVPGVVDPAGVELFRLASSAPAWGRSLAAGDDLVLTFAGGEPDPASVTAAVHARDASDTLLGIGAIASGATLTVVPPPGGWPAEAWVELHATLRSTDGRPLIPVAVPVSGL